MRGGNVAYTCEHTLIPMRDKTASVCAACVELNIHNCGRIVYALDEFIHKQKEANISDTHMPSVTSLCMWSLKLDKNERKIKETRQNLRNVMISDSFQQKIARKA